MKAFFQGIVKKMRGESNASDSELAEQVLELNREGVRLSSEKKEWEAFKCYARAIQLSPHEHLAYQNAGHACVILEKWQVGHLFASLRFGFCFCFFLFRRTCGLFG